MILMTQNDKATAGTLLDMLLVEASVGAVFIAGFPKLAEEALNVPINT
jgi:hypothetical protein